MSEMELCSEIIQIRVGIDKAFAKNGSKFVSMPCVMYEVAEMINKGRDKKYHTDTLVSMIKNWIKSKWNKHYVLVDDNGKLWFEKVL